MTEDSIIRKIRACLARADADRNDNPAERATALRQANALMDKHNISIAELESSNVSDLGELGTSEFSLDGHHRWKGNIAQSIAKLYGCNVWLFGGGYHTKVAIAGREVLRTATLEMTKYVIASILREEAKSCKGKGKTFRNSFKDGAPIGVSATVRQILAEREERAPSEDGSGTAMVLANLYETHMDDVRNWMEYSDIELGKPRMGRHIRDSEGFAQGVRAGRNISLNEQLEN